MNQPPVGEDVEIINLQVCQDRQRSLYHAHGTTTFPKSLADTLRFNSRGANSRGRFEVSQSGDPGSDEIVVDVDAFFRREDALDEVLVCRLHPAEREFGVGIYTGDRSNIHEHALSLAPDVRLNIYEYTTSLRFVVHLRLPAPDDPADGPLHIRSLSTDMPLFSHHLCELAGSVFFKGVTLRTDDAPIHVESLAGDNMSFVTNNGGVHGKLLAMENLSATTRNGPIAVRATLINDPGIRPTPISLQTDNGPIEAKIYLKSIARDGTGGTFDVAASTTNGPLTVEFQDAPIGSVLNASLQTCNGPARVAVHSTFEGRYELHGFPFLRPSVSVRPCLDPTGRRRRRDVTTTNAGMGVVRGHVRWQSGLAAENRQGRDSFVSVRTANAPLHASF